MRNVGVLLLFVIGGVIVWAIMRPQQANASVVDRVFGRGTDQAIQEDITTGARWYDYWRAVLSDTYQRSGVMPPEGPLVTCIVAPCPGTPVPQSP